MKCDNLGNYASDCKVGNSKEISSKTSTNANIKESENEDFIFHTQSSFRNGTKNIWLLDSGATNHLCCIKSMFQDFKPYNYKVRVGDGRELKGMDLCVNLVSIGRWSIKGYKILFEREKCSIILNNEIIIKSNGWKGHLKKVKISYTERNSNIRSNDKKVNDNEKFNNNQVEIKNKSYIVNDSEHKEIKNSNIRLKKSLSKSDIRSIEKSEVMVTKAKLQKNTKNYSEVNIKDNETLGSKGLTNEQLENENRSFHYLKRKSKFDYKRHKLKG
ncbi:unnamed protein product [Brachionus calyciflorus]|uniref:Retrovirus-related Pol polyprotein from transposon TNT 1-94-like beta-barrel domain-containing protein n=1 Tax=Brachionus calyciflorus TaxID=104777 RepID=A0A813WLM7_9BILA|nr:unnamed protein product [Brachionus calyciflorus]